VAEREGLYMTGLDCAFESAALRASDMSPICHPLRFYPSFANGNRLTATIAHRASPWADSERH